MKLENSGSMPRTRRVPTAGFIQHVINRGNYKRRLFSTPDDYRDFLGLMAKAVERIPVRLLAFCLMPNHWHLVVWPTEEGMLSAYMHWLTTAHVRRFQSRHDEIGLGHVYQGRYRVVAVQDERQLLQLLLYVEANPLRAGLVKRAEDWRWSSLRLHMGRPGQVTLVSSPVKRPPNWLEMVNEPPVTPTEP